jgi:hypothetical protein
MDEYFWSYRLVQAWEGSVNTEVWRYETRIRHAEYTRENRLNAEKPLDVLPEHIAQKIALLDAAKGEDGYGYIEGVGRVDADYFGGMIEYTLKGRLL